LFFSWLVCEKIVLKEEKEKKVPSCPFFLFFDSFWWGVCEKEEER
jgi:hypothetical protein